MPHKTYEIRDVVYGFIQLDQQEWDIINDPVYQRLRRIKQLSLTDMVYPGATHTRFEHSLGVMQMATEMYDSITFHGKQSRLLLEEEYKLDDSGIARYRKIVRLAALLHDIGHPPFSHAGEELMPINQDTGARFTHEDYSIAIIEKLFKAHIEKHPVNSNYGIRVYEVTALLGSKNSEYSLDGKLLLFKELISGQLDADRADYLLRDSVHTGVNYGVYDRNRLINCIGIGQIEETGALVLAIQEGGWHIAESLIIARYQMFSQVYFHKTRQAYDGHIEKAAKAILETAFPAFGGYYPDLEHLNDYVDFDDWCMYGLLKENFGGIHGNIVLNRKHYRLAFETNSIPSESDLDSLTEKEEKLKSNGIDYFLRTARTYWYRLDKDIWICNDSTGAVKELSRKSSIVESMIDTPQMKRLYAQKVEGEV